MIFVCLWELQVERIVDKRRNKKGKWEYLIRWKGYGSKEDTWEPENHLMHCEEFIDQFNSLRLHSQRRHKVSKSRQESLITAESSRPRSDARKKKRIVGPAVGVRGGGVPGAESSAAHKLGKVGVGSSKPSIRTSRAMTYKPVARVGGAHLDPAVTLGYNGLQNGEAEPLPYTAAAAASHRVPLHRSDGVPGETDASGPQFTKELGKK